MLQIVTDILSYNVQIPDRIYFLSWIALSYILHNSGGSRGGSGGSNEPLLSLNYFIFMGTLGKIVQTAHIEPPSANLNPRSKNPGSAPATIAPSKVKTSFKLSHGILWLIHNTS